MFPSLKVPNVNIIVWVDNFRVSSAYSRGYVEPRNMKSRNPQDISQYSRIGPRGELWTPKIRIFVEPEMPFPTLLRSVSINVSVCKLILAGDGSYFSKGFLPTKAPTVH